MTDSPPLVYLDACVFLEVLQQRPGQWRESLKALRAAERRDIRVVASRLLAVEIGRFRGDASQPEVDHLILQYLDGVGVRWAEVDLLISREARTLSWKHAIKSGADAVHLATAVRFGADFFMSRNGGFPYGQKIDATLVTEPKVVWAPTLEDAQIDEEQEPSV